MVSDRCIDWRTRRYLIPHFGQYQNNSIVFNNSVLTLFADESWWTAADCELKRASICSYQITA